MFIEEVHDIKKTLQERGYGPQKNFYEHEFLRVIDSLIDLHAENEKLRDRAGPMLDRKTLETAKRTEELYAEIDRLRAFIGKSFCDYEDIKEDRDEIEEDRDKGNEYYDKAIRMLESLKTRHAKLRTRLFYSKEALERAIGLFKHIRDGQLFPMLVKHQAKMLIAMAEVALGKIEERKGGGIEFDGSKT